MSDITKCGGHGCQQKDSCWRFLAPADPYRQSYSDFWRAGVGCQHYWTLTPTLDKLEQDNEKKEG